MSLDKLKKLEQDLAVFKERYLNLEEERDGLLCELKGLKDINDCLTHEKEEVKLKVESLLDILKGLGL